MIINLRKNDIATIYAAIASALQNEESFVHAHDNMLEKDKARVKKRYLAFARGCQELKERIERAERKERVTQ